MKKIIVLGGGGFIGGHLSKRLKNDKKQKKEIKRLCGKNIALIF